MIIVEGADGVGKTTLCKKLAVKIQEILKIDNAYRHMSKPADDFDHLAGYFREIGPHAQDRFHLGSIVYGVMLRRGNAPTPQKMKLLQRYLRWQGAVVIVMYGSREWLHKQLIDSPKPEMYSVDDILLANEGFAALATEHNRGEPFADIPYNCTTDKWPSDSFVDSMIIEWKRRFLNRHA